MPMTFLRQLARVLRWLREAVLNLLFLGLLLVILAGLFSSESAPPVPDGAALVLAPSGEIVEESEPLDPLRLLMSGGSDQPAETLLRDLLAVLRAASGDDRIAALVLRLQDLGAAQPAALEELGAAIERFKASGKPVIAMADYYSQTQYYLASFADEVYMNPMGELLLTGYGVFGTYFGEALGKLGINVHVFRVGTYKSAVEPFLRNGMSAPAKQANRELLDTLWHATRDTIARNRGLEPAAVQAYADDFPEILAAAGQDMARAAVEQGLVDDLMTRDRMRARLVDLVGEDGQGGFRGITSDRYLPHARALNRAADAGADGEVAIVVARGPIMPGEQPRNRVGADSIAQLIREVRRNDRYRALVLRVDSPGGSSFAAELIRQELELTRLAGKPVVVSMSGTAASGGYWISASADEIWAAPTTITGSIGIFAILPTFEQGLARLGVYGDGVGATALAGSADPTRGISEPMSNILQASVEAGYRQFVERVASGRDLSLEAVDAVAQGRVWSGTAAREHGLVDELGYLGDAVASAARLAGLESWRAIWVRKPESPREQLLRQLMRSAGIDADYLAVDERGWIMSLIEPLAVLRDPGRLYALCLTCRITSTR